MPLKTRISVWLLAAGLGVTTCACRSHGVDVTVQNNASVPIRNVEVDYPGAAFGAPVIVPGKSYWYHIKPTGDGEISLSFEMENGKTFHQKGPTVHASDGGKMILIVELDASQQWRMRAQALAQR